jgi:hypothetical protein
MYGRILSSPKGIGCLQEMNEKNVTKFDHSIYILHHNNFTSNIFYTQNRFCFYYPAQSLSNLQKGSIVFLPGMRD